MSCPMPQTVARAKQTRILIPNTNAYSTIYVRLYVRVLWLNRYNPSHEYGLKTRNAAT